ncbi:Heme NO binding protein [Stieleria bergensis]|uniref:Heme NO binding protein n=1 Tax=Stieleria bergensis TaxID=2528025 RepID=A0A517T0K9_9BACT|nr:Heme NO binding protein [Planctomycetes bacterium SV_7m_r]
MKGVVFVELIDMVQEQMGLEVLETVLASVDSPSDGAYTAVGTYADQELYDIVAALSKETSLGANQLLYAFGKHLFARLSDRYPAQVGSVSNCFELLTSLEQVIHPNVKKLYPEATLPSFETTQHPDGSLEMRYKSPRGLPDLAEGLMQGCADWFNEPITIEREVVDANGNEVIFRLRRGEDNGAT